MSRLPTGFNFVLLFTAISYLVWRFSFRRSSTPPLPPGPKKLPLVGNLLNMPREREWEKFAEWKKQYGDIVSMTILGQTLIVVNTAKAATEMLDKKSRIYSDRPVVPMCDFIGWGDVLGLTGYNERFRNYRRVFQKAVGSKAAVSKFNNMGETETRRFLNLLLDEPDNFLDHIRRTTGSVILRITYGYETQGEKDPFLAAAKTAMDQLSVAVSPGGFLINYMPALQHLPDWFPGAGFKRVAKEWGKSLNAMVEGPFQFAKQEMANGTAKPSVVSNLMQDGPKLSEDDIRDIKWVAESFFMGGAESTLSNIVAFFKAMVLYPDIQAKAQAEIDAVIGNDRLPTAEDRESLPYVSALVSEVLRWHIGTPNGAPHRLMEDDIHDGYLIPKGSIVISNICDPEVYENPKVFDPTRFIKAEDHEPEPDPRGIVFGFGRRICPGRLLADSSMYITLSMTLAVYNISPSMENGKAVMPDLSQGVGMISHPSPFKCNIVPRSGKAIALIKSGTFAR